MLYNRQFQRPALGQAFYNIVYCTPFAQNNIHFAQNKPATSSSPESKIVNRIHQGRAHC